MNSMKRQKDMTLEEEVPRSIGAQYATGKKRNSTRRNEEAEPTWKQLLGVDVSGGESKVQCCREQCCIGTWNIRSTNQGKLKVVQKERARVNIDISGNGQKWVNLFRNHCI